jgi:hypothetical protein
MTGSEAHRDEGARSFLKFGDSQWQLRGTTNLDHLEARIKAAMRSGEALDIEIEAGRDGASSARVVLNGRALPYVELWNEDERSGEA